ncbi:Gfo/Idh/MocA family protein [Marichromatium sp. AB31]|uniref:Gfo/Idh/MocA family protein n=1 Tax=Marichromatium sp. AB31 TaxID=2483362 RepID=UPI000F3D3A6C|nr:Gfo/Idh/MocA family oxidoreductase [Marichromatium sp. AB31]MBO8087026.1 Gfo/Idh/MocA family oxidoreductase [Marichromatium sp.]RNE88669.1 gfo/Idh/MocA family oxidoreductase [Marichromatium sp. AB31]
MSSSSQSRLRVAVIGVGYLGRFHALIYSRHPEVDLVGVVDADPARARAIADEAGCAVFADAAALIAHGVDAVSVVVPTTAHLEAAAPFLSRGIHVLLEKPIATTAEEGRELVRLAEQNGATLQIGHVERFNAGVMALAQRIEAPRYIEAQRMGGFVERATDVDVVSDLMIHDIDIILSLIGAEISHISAVGTSVLTEHVDIANARLEFTNGAVANVVASRVSERTTRRIRVFQPRRYLALDFIAQTIDIAAPHQVEGEPRPRIERERVQVEAVKPLDCEIAAFVETVRGGGAPLVDGRTGLKALEVALEVRARIGA